MLFSTSSIFSILVAVSLPTLSIAARNTPEHDLPTRTIHRRATDPLPYNTADPVGHVRSVIRSCGLTNIKGCHTFFYSGSRPITPTDKRAPGTRRSDADDGDVPADFHSQQRLASDISTQRSRNRRIGRESSSQHLLPLRLPGAEDGRRRHPGRVRHGHSRHQRHLPHFSDERHDHQLALVL